MTMERDGQRMTDSPVPAPYRLVDEDVIVIKVGSNSLMAKDGLTIDEPYMSNLAAQIARLVEQNLRVILVSSGSCSAGMTIMNMRDKPDKIEERQALSSIGQIHIITKWENAFAPFNIRCSQLLLTQADFSSRKSCKNLCATLKVLFAWKIVPIVNENDPIATHEVTVGDNDRLSSLLAVQVAARDLLLLTDINGLYDKDPRYNPNARKLDVVETVTEEMLGAAGGPGAKGRGGMRSKLESARFAAAAGVCAIIAHSREEQVIDKTILNPNSGVGTRLLPYSFNEEFDGPKLGEHQRWVACQQAAGVLTLKESAPRSDKYGNQYIHADDIDAAHGTFQAGDPVSIVTQSGYEIGRGMAQVSVEELPQAAGEIVSTDDLVVLEPTFGVSPT